MLKEKEFPVHGDNGFQGTLLSTSRFLDSGPEKRIRLEDGSEIRVASSALEAQPDGSYYLHMTGPPAGHAEQAPEQAQAPRQIVTPSASEPLFREDCDVERVPVRRMIDQPAEIRQEGDTLIIPLMEEVLVTEKRLMLREELHIKRRRENKGDSDRTPL